MKQSAAVIGQGFVGGTLTTVLTERHVDVFVYDKGGVHATGGDPSRFAGIAEMAMHCEQNVPNFSRLYFVCVPTPMYEDGAADTRIVESVLAELAAVPGQRIAVVKSTVPPGSTDVWNRRFNSQGLTIVFNPEFLTEANALEDMRHQSRIVLGGPKEAMTVVRDFFQTAFPTVPILKTSHATTAEMVKYFTNIQLAVRVVLSCELHQISQALTAAGHEVDYDRVLEFAKYDKRLGGSHMNVPGAEGIMGARGHCFPKDLNALMHLARDVGADASLLESAWAKNLRLVPPEHRDWERMNGRAVSRRD